MCSLVTSISRGNFPRRGRVRWTRFRSTLVTRSTIRFSSTAMGYSIRKAKLEDRSDIQQLIAESARGLSRAHYSDAQIEAAIATVFGVDTSLIDDGTYFVVEETGQLIGCGGWSKRRTLYGGDQFADRDVSYLDPDSDPAKIRAFFIHPCHA